MTEKRFTLSKNERLSWKRYIDLLFEKGQSFIAFPLRVIFYTTEEEMPAQSSILISVSKKRLKRAVKRNKIKRQVREAYRLQKNDLLPLLNEKKTNLLIAFLYIDKEIHEHSVIEKAMAKTIKRLNENV
jgi:ribonuclease P protein component, eubacterial